MVKSSTVIPDQEAVIGKWAVGATKRDTRLGLEGRIVSKKVA